VGGKATSDEFFRSDVQQFKHITPKGKLKKWLDFVQQCWRTDKNG